MEKKKLSEQDCKKIAYGVKIKGQLEKLANTNLNS